MKGELLWMHYRQENIRKQKKRYMKKIFLLGILGCLFAFQQAFAQTDSIGDTHELKNVVVKATNGVKAKSRVDNTEHRKGPAHTCRLLQSGRVVYGQSFGGCELQ